MRNAWRQPPARRFEGSARLVQLTDLAMEVIRELGGFLTQEVSMRGSKGAKRWVWPSPTPRRKMRPGACGVRGHLVERLERMAFEHGVEIYRDADLAEALSAIDVRSAVPPGSTGPWRKCWRTVTGSMSA